MYYITLGVLTNCHFPQLTFLKRWDFSATITGLGRWQAWTGTRPGLEAPESLHASVLFSTPVPLKEQQTVLHLLSCQEARWFNTSCTANPSLSHWVLEKLNHLYVSCNKTNVTSGLHLVESAQNPQFIFFLYPFLLIAAATVYFHHGAHESFIKPYLTPSMSLTNI